MPLPAPPLGAAFTVKELSPPAGVLEVIWAPVGVLSTPGKNWTTSTLFGKFPDKTKSPLWIKVVSPAILVNLKESVVADSAISAVMVLKLVVDIWPILDSVLILAIKGLDSTE